MTTSTNNEATSVEAAVSAERERCLALIGLCGESGISQAAIGAIKSGETQEAFAIGLVQRGKGGDRAARLRDLATQAGQPSVSRPGR
ncbi:MAG: hypothetical protein ACRYHC_10800 [Janthinobacterium lividum]